MKTSTSISNMKQYINTNITNKVNSKPKQLSVTSTSKQKIKVSKPNSMHNSTYVYRNNMAKCYVSLSREIS